jgi:hypothetical protein
MRQLVARGVARGKTAADRGWPTYHIRCIVVIVIRWLNPLAAGGRNAESPLAGMSVVISYARLDIIFYCLRRWANVVLPFSRRIEGLPTVEHIMSTSPAVQRERRQALTT